MTARIPDISLDLALSLVAASVVPVLLLAGKLEDVMASAFLMSIKVSPIEEADDRETCCGVLAACI